MTRSLRASPLRNPDKMKRQTGHSGLAFSYLIGRCVALSIRLGFRLGFRAALRVGLLLGLLYDNVR